jgi:hypothetical protein
MALTETHGACDSTFDAVGHSDWLAQLDGDHEQWTLERDAGAGPHKPEYELVLVRDPQTGKFVWGIRETSLALPRVSRASSLM